MPVIARRTCLLGLLLLLAACGGKGSADSSGASPQDVLSKAATRFQALKSFHFKLDHQNGSIPIILGLRLVTAEGDEIVPNRLSADVQARAGPTAVHVKVIGIDDKTWVTNPFTREFQRAPGNTAVSDIVDPVGLVTSVASSMQQAKISGAEPIDGVSCYHVSGTLQSDALTKSLTFADAGRTVSVEAWIGKDDSLLRRARIKGALVQDDSNDVVREIDLSKFDVPVTIEAPQ